MNIKILAILLAALPLTLPAFAGEKSAEKTAPATCPVSGEEIGSMGKGYEYTYKVEGKPDQKVLLCCKSCVTKFEKNPDKYLKAAHAAPEATAKAEEHTEHAN